MPLLLLLLLPHCITCITTTLTHSRHFPLSPSLSSSSSVWLPTVVAVIQDQRSTGILQKFSIRYLLLCILYNVHNNKTYYHFHAALRLPRYRKVVTTMISTPSSSPPHMYTQSKNRVSILLSSWCIHFVATIFTMKMEQESAKQVTKKPNVYIM